MYAISCYIGPIYNDTWLYIQLGMLTSQSLPGLLQVYTDAINLKVTATHLNTGFHLQMPVLKISMKMKVVMVMHLSSQADHNLLYKQGTPFHVKAVTMAMFSFQ